MEIKIREFDMMMAAQDLSYEDITVIYDKKEHLNKQLEELLEEWVNF